MSRRCRNSESIFLQLPPFWHAKNRTPHTFAAAAFHAFDAVDVEEAIYFYCLFRINPVFLIRDFIYRTG